jgi:hypothetical protein
MVTPALTLDISFCFSVFMNDIIYFQEWFSRRNFLGDSYHMEII